MIVQSTHRLGQTPAVLAAGRLAAGRVARLPWLVVVLVSVAGIAFGQRAARSFESVSINAVTEPSGDQCGAAPCDILPSISITSTEFHAVVPVSGPMGLIEWAYGVREFQVAGLPELLVGKKFEVRAVAGAPVSEAQMKEMVRGMLEDRFQLKQHHESRQIPVYLLLESKVSPALKPVEEAVGSEGSVEMRSGRLVGKAASIDLLAAVLSQNLERPVVNKTDLARRYNFDVGFKMPADKGHEFLPLGSALLAPIQELGFKLEASSEVVVLLVVDGMEWPSKD